MALTKASMSPSVPDGSIGPAERMRRKPHGEWLIAVADSLSTAC